MYSVNIEKQCSCFKKSDIILPKKFDSKEKAELEALKLVNHMNATFCKKHRFFVTEENQELTIRVELSCPQEIK